MSEILDSSPSAQPATHPVLAAAWRALAAEMMAEPPSEHDVVCAMRAAHLDAGQPVPEYYS